MIVPKKDQHTLIVIEGPTAVGKTTAAISLAQHFDTEIISADSRQFYRELKIGTAAPTPEELDQVPHHFVGNLSIHDYYNASRFENDVLQLLPSLFKKHKVVVMVGGSGLYIDAVCKGINDLPDIPEELRKKLKIEYQKKGIEYLQELLKKHDPEYYEQVDLQNHTRLLRALEVIFISGKKFSELRAKPTQNRDFQIIEIGLKLERSVLNEKIHKRVDLMLQNGLMDEVKECFSNRHLNTLNTIGYKEFFEWMEGKVPFEQAVENLKTNTRRYAKRQMTWFCKNGQIKWFYSSDLNNFFDFCDAFIKE